MASSARRGRRDNHQSGQEHGNVRKRVSNACSRCRRQKIRCSGTAPCTHCVRRNVACDFQFDSAKVSVSQTYISRLQEEIAALRNAHHLPSERVPSSDDDNLHHNDLNSNDDNNETIGEVHGVGPMASCQTPLERSGRRNLEVRHANTPSGSEDVANSDAVSAVVDAGQGNPLIDSDNVSAFAFDTHGRPYFLGVSSNWSFGRRVLSMVHERVNEQPLATASLLFDGATYELGWDGQRCVSSADTALAPDSDYATFLINAVKFRCGRLFHLFDETLFMQDFASFYSSPRDDQHPPVLWFVQYLLILALGKAFTVRGNTNTATPPGADFYVQAMRMLPDITFLYRDPVHAVEVLCCASLYLQCLDHRSAAYNLIGQSMRIAIEQGMHTNMASHNLEPNAVERCREAWWTTYILDRKMSALLGTPITLSDDDITAVLPSFSGSSQKSSALRIHVRLSKATAAIVRTVYSRTETGGDLFLTRMKDALRTLASANDEQNANFPLNLENRAGLCRFSAYLYLFQHQCLVLATRPLLFGFWQKRLDTTSTLHVSDHKGARSLLRVCVSSAHQCLIVLHALWEQGLLDSFLPFDRDAVFSSTVVLLLAAIVDPSLVRNRAPPLPTAYAVLDEMISWGNLIAKLHKQELEQLDTDLQKLPNSTSMRLRQASKGPETMSNIMGPFQSSKTVFPSPDEYFLNTWSSEDGLTGDQLLGLADSLNFEQFDWLGENGSEALFTAS